MTYTHSTTENIKNGANTYDRQNIHAGVLNSKQELGQNLNAPTDFKSS